MAGIKAAQRRPDAVHEMCFVHRGRRYRMSFTNFGRAIVKSYKSRAIVAVSWPGAIDQHEDGA